MAKAVKKKSKKKKARKRVKIGPGASKLLVLFLVIFTISIIAYPYIRRSIHDTGSNLPGSVAISGDFVIDISHYQGKIVWDSLMVMTDANGKTTRDLTRSRQAWPVGYAYIKATEGEQMVDPEFAENWESAGSSRIRRGAYHFFRSSKDPVKQAENFISTVGSMTWKDLPPVLDVETMHKGCTRAELNSKLLIWLETVEERYGRKPIVYSSESFIRDNLDSRITERYPIWVAHYGVESPQREDWLMWQFTDKAVVMGAEGKIDLSVVRPGLTFK